MENEGSKPQALRTQIFQKLKNRIEAGTWEIGEKFPSEYQLLPRVWS
jgi:DNA-binding GntR family transcriptional regulator